ncbi:hypothetical protein I79_013019 [Cricetulus griseus]|uniref:Uncharacterized protein n=1 Tax=Cricetulus griseus TaxID=10029 RepID=G3HQC2_CRIGR|nr:hypothetical protein I79_013019 [Cricetulus griseus]
MLKARGGCVKARRVEAGGRRQELSGEGPLLLDRHCQEASSFGCVFSILEYFQKLGTSLEVENVEHNKA